MYFNLQILLSIDQNNNKRFYQKNAVVGIPDVCSVLDPYFTKADPDPTIWANADPDPIL